MKILVIAPCWDRSPPSIYGPAEQLAHDLVEALVARDHEVTLFATGDSETSGQLAYAYDHPSPDHVVELEMGHAQAAAAYAAAHDFDIVHNHEANFGVKYLLERDTPVVTRVNWLGDPSFKQILTTTTDRQRNNHYFVAISNRQRDLMPYVNWTDTIYNGIDPAQYPFGPVKEPYLLFLGRINEEKGADTAIDVALRARMPLVIAGTLRPGWMDYFETRVHPHVDGINIIWLGPASRSSKLQLLSRASALLFPIRWEEPFGLVMLEALACGTPVIALNKGSVAEVIVEGQNGFIADDVGGMVSAVRRLDTISTTYCRRYVEESFTVELMATRYVELYQKILGTNA